MSGEALLHEPLSVFLTVLSVLLVAPWFSERFHLPGIVGLVIGGILIGPFGFHILAEDSIIELLATVGLIYLMFNAGLEIDLDQFNRVRRKAVIFGFLTFTAPLLAGMVLGRLFGFGWAGAILFGSALSSHTLLAFPILARLGVITNETVSVTVGATVLTDILAFLVLAIITGAGGGSANFGQLALLVIMLFAFAAVILVGLPKLGKYLLQYLRGRDAEFQFVLVALLISAVTAEIIGVHAVVGAFLTGLAINSMLPHRSQVIGRLLFVGEALFIPCFLVYSGMITDPAAFLGGDALTYGLGMTIIAYLAKLAAAILTARLYGYDPNEMMTIWGLSQCQAAVTLPTVLVGVEASLFSQSVFSGTMLMILATSISSPLLVQHYAGKLRLPERRTQEQHLFDRVLVAVSNPQTHERIITLMDIVVGTRGGILMPLNVALDTKGHITGLENQAHVLQSEVLQNTETRIQPIARIDDSLAKGVLYAAAEHQATLIALGWRGRPTYHRNIFGSVLDEVLWGAKIPVLVARLTEPVDALKQVVMVIAPNSTAVNYLDEMADAAVTIADAINIPLLILTAQPYHALICDCIAQLDVKRPHVVHILASNVVKEIEKTVHPQDLLILSTTGTRKRFQSSLGHLPEDLAAKLSVSLMVIHYPQEPANIAPTKV